MNFQHLLQSSLNQSSSALSGPLPPSPGSQDLGRTQGAGGGPFCLRNYPVLREDMDVVSARFQLLDRVSVPVWSDVPSLVRLHLNTGMDSGGSLTISVQLNKVPFLFVFLGLHPRRMEVPRLGVQSELQLLACTRATAPPDLSCICDLHHSSWQCQIPGPLVSSWIPVGSISTAPQWELPLSASASRPCSDFGLGPSPAHWERCHSSLSAPTLAQRQGQGGLLGSKATPD